MRVRIIVYVICPTYSLHDGNIYISAVLINRQGKVAREYHKMRPAESELEMGIKPGKANPPVFETDFGKIGIQICFDVKYEKGWNNLKDKAFIPTWPAVSLFPDIQKKYGPRPMLTTFSEEEWTIMESLDDGLKIADVLKEFNLKSMHETLKELSAAHEKAGEKA